MPQPEGRWPEESACWNADGACQHGSPAIFWPCSPDRALAPQGPGGVVDARRSPRYGSGTLDAGLHSLRVPAAVLDEETKRHMANMAKKIDMLSLQVDTCLHGISNLQTTVSGFPEQLQRNLNIHGSDSTHRTDRTDITGRSQESIDAVHISSTESAGHHYHLEVLGQYQKAKSEQLATPQTSLQHPDKDESRQIAVTTSDNPQAALGVSYPAVPAVVRRFSGTQMNLARFRPKRSKTAEAIWKFLEEPESSTAARYFALVWVPFIFASVIVTLSQSVKPPPIKGKVAGIFELSFDAIFALEALLRVCVAPSKTAFFLSAYNIIDVLAALPFVGRMVVGLDAAPLPGNPAVGAEAELALVLVCLSPVLRLLKTLRRFQQFHLFMAVLSFTSEALKFLLLTLVLIVLTFSSLIYLVEPRDNIETLPKAMWLTVVTMTTVGYGDVTPDTNTGHGIVAVLLVLSVLFMAMPIGIIGNAFTEMWKDRDRILLNHRFQERLVQCGYTAHDIAGMFMQYDTDKNGELSLSEFVAMVHDMNLGLTEERAVQLFESIDKDGSGGIDAREFVREFFPTRFNEIYGDREATKKDERAEDEEPQRRSSARSRRSRRGSKDGKGGSGSARRSKLQGEKQMPVAEGVEKDWSDEPQRWLSEEQPPRSSNWSRRAESLHEDLHGEAGTGGVPPGSGRRNGA